MENVGTEAVESQVMRQVSGLQSALDKAEDQVATIEGRLESVLRPSTPEAETKTAEGPCNVPLAEEIRMQENRVRKISRSLADLMERLEA